MSSFYDPIGGSQREFNESAWTRSEYIYDTVEMFDIYNMRWQQVTPMNSGRILPGIAVLNGKGKNSKVLSYNIIINVQYRFEIEFKITSCIVG